MSLIIAAALISPAFHGVSGTQPPPAANAILAATSGMASSPGAISASAWVILLDRQQWGESWDAAGALFKAEMPKARWASTIEPVRQPLGKVVSRSVQSATKASSLPGAPPGDYEIIQFKTNFMQKHDAIETVVLAHEGASWKVNGYFIR